MEKNRDRERQWVDVFVQGLQGSFCVALVLVRPLEEEFGVELLRAEGAIRAAIARKAHIDKWAVPIGHYTETVELMAQMKTGLPGVRNQCVKGQWNRTGKVRLGAGTVNATCV